MNLATGTGNSEYFFWATYTERRSALKRKSAAILLEDSKLCNASQKRNYKELQRNIWILDHLFCEFR